MKEARSPSPRITYLLKWVERGLRVRMDAALEPYGLTTPEYTALSVLCRRDRLSSAQLARRTLVTAQAMNQVVIRLQDRKLISRSPDPNHGRSQQITLTAKGKTLVASCDKATASIEDQMLEGLTRAEVHGLRRSLESCVDALGRVA